MAHPNAQSQAFGPPVPDDSAMHGVRLRLALYGACALFAAALLLTSRQLLGPAALLLAALAGAAIIEAAVRALLRPSLYQRRQRAEMERLAQMVECTGALMVLTDADDLVLWVNAAFCSATGWTLPEARGRRPGELLASPQADESVLRRMHEAQRDRLGIRERWLHRTRGGAELWLDVDLRPLQDEAGQPAGFVRVCSEVVAPQPPAAPLPAPLPAPAEAARFDPLTELPNRAVVMERLQRAVEHARRHPGYGFAVLFMDFDRFKQVNDTLGHAAGDELLRQVAQRLTLTLRPGDAVARLEADATSSVAARLGGDEFVVVLEGVGDAQRAAAVAERLLAELAEPYLVEATPVHSSVSIGVVLCGGLRADAAAVPSAEDLLRHADTAMYEAKRAGRGRWVLFDDSMQERLVRALAMENDLRRALRENELFVVYQPVLHLDGRVMTGVEALVRWRHPQRGLVPPGDFIGVAEECGLIDALGAQVLEMACRQFMRWQTTLGVMAPQQLAVNLSRAQLRRSALVDDVRAVLLAHGMAPEQLQLEVTESLAAQDETVQTTLRALKNLGVRLALDDFGTGYSSLACLHQMPVDTVKIDRSFVKHAESVEYHRVLIEATIRVARTLGMTTVAEGIETEGQAELMLSLECDRGQGFLFSRPQEAADLESWAREHFQDMVDTL